MTARHAADQSESFPPTRKIRLTVGTCERNLFVWQFFALCIQQGSESDFDWTPREPEIVAVGRGCASAFASRRRPSLDRVYSAQTACTEPQLDNNNDWCEACNGSGSFLCCEGCPRSFHFACLEPPMDPCALPESAWFCAMCHDQGSPSLMNNGSVGKQQPKAKIRLKASPFFWPLPRQNPSEFALPLEITLPYPNPRPFASEANLGLLCHKCGLSALQAPLARCTECPLAWHYDCLTPPLCSEPSQVDWCCPVHPEYYAEGSRKHKRKQLRPLCSVDVDTESEIRVALAFKSGKPHLGARIRFGSGEERPSYVAFGCSTEH